jgi:hypothetical protein
LLELFWGNSRIEKTQKILDFHHLGKKSGENTPKKKTWNITFNMHHLIINLILRSSQDHKLK